MAADGQTLVFEKTTTITDVDHMRLSLPTQALEYLPSFEPGSNRMSFAVWDEQTGVRFNFECWRRRGMGHPKPVVSGGWREYVRTKELVVGDDIVLSMVPDPSGGVRYKIDVFRRSLRLFGVVIPLQDVA